jgi:hypothetical protein
MHAGEENKAKESRAMDLFNVLKMLEEGAEKIEAV